MQARMHIPVIYLPCVFLLARIAFLFASSYRNGPTYRLVSKVRRFGTFAHTSPRGLLPPGIGSSYCMRVGVEIRRHCNQFLQGKISSSARLSALFLGVAPTLRSKRPLVRAITSLTHGNPCAAADLFNWQMRADSPTEDPADSVRPARRQLAHYLTLTRMNHRPTKPRAAAMPISIATRALSAMENSQLRATLLLDRTVTVQADDDRDREEYKTDEVVHTGAHGGLTKAKDAATRRPPQLCCCLLQLLEF